MITRKAEKEYRLSKWSGIIQERYNSGESVRSWCRKNGIVEKTYYHWQRKCRLQNESGKEKAPHS